MVDCRLLADVVDKRFAADLIVRLEDVVDVLDHVLLVAHRTSGLGRMLEPDDDAVTAIVERVLLNVGGGMRLATTKGQSMSTTPRNPPLTSSEDCR